MLLLKFQNEGWLTDRARNAPPIEMTSEVPGALLSISAGLGKQHLMRLQIKQLTLKTELSLGKIKDGRRILYEPKAEIEGRYWDRGEKEEEK